VTIVTPTLNRGPLLEGTIRSVKAQTYPALEHIVVDGGSTDSTLELLGRYEGTYRLRWVSEPDEGMYAAVNKGMRLAEGEIVAYLNSDDLYVPWAVETVVEHFLRHPDVDFVFGASVAVDDDSGVQTMRFEPPFDLDYIRRCGFLCQPAVFWRAAAGRAVGPFDETLRFAADIDYWMRAGADHRFSKVDELIAIERNHSDTIRERQHAAIVAELASVRGRYVKLSGPFHRLALVRHTVRVWAWRRLPWFTMAAQALRRPRRGPWARMLRSGQPEVRWHLVPLKMIPFVSRRIPRVLRPSRIWLEPPP
jgi:glycosyltransferase involved in cell wall biosynthesis